jgi:hypothetical protein
MKLPNVSCPIDNENDLGIVEFGCNSEVMLSRPAPIGRQYTMDFGSWGT